MPPKKARGGGGGGAAGPKAHQLAEEMPQGELLNDLMKGKWRVGPKLGQGGFGLIYLATNAEGKSTAEPTHVVKQEPAGNGPLALECLFYAGTMKVAKLESWAKSKRITDLGLPKYVGWGMHTFKGRSNRFLVMDRFGADLQKLFLERGNRFPRVVVAQMALRLIDSLHYLHDNRYVHADIKAANILLPFSKAAKQPPVKTVYLVDFGLTAKYADSDGTHKPYKQDPKRAHDGTVEFTSRDAHMGVAPSRRGDMEILGYCLVQWLCGRLPWEDKLTDKNYVADQKCKFMKDIPASMKRLFPSASASGKGVDGVPTEIQKYLQLVEELEYTEEPDYNQFKEVFKTFLRSQGISSEATIDFGSAASASSSSTSKRSSSAAAKSAPKASSKASKNSAVFPSSESDDDVDDSMSMAFPPATKKTTTAAAKTAAGRKKPVKKTVEPLEEEEEEDETMDLLPVKKGKSVSASTSRTTASTSRSAASSRTTTASPRKSASSSSLIPSRNAASPRLTPSSSRSATSTISASSSAASRSRKRTNADEEVGEPLKELPINSPTPKAKKPRLIKVKRNVQTTDSKTQTTPKVQRAK